MRRSPSAKPADPKPSRFSVSETLLSWARIRPKRQGALQNPFALPAVPPSVAPAKDSRMAMDDALGGWCGGGSPGGWAYNQLNESYAGLYGGSLTHFIGYPQLAILAQKPEYRKAIETIATEMTRRWIKISATNDGNETQGEDDDKSDKIAQLGDAMDRLRVRDVFREAVIHDGGFGRGHIFIDLNDSLKDDGELKTSIGNGRNNASQSKISKGSLKAIRTVEPMWVYPVDYNTTDPLKGDWYKPQSWLVMNRRVHASRLLTLVGREVPDILKPAYMFGGLSLSQMMLPYVERWEKTTKSISDLLRAFTVWILKSDLSTTAQSNELERRVGFFEMIRDNRGIMLLNKETEDFGNISANLSTLDHLQAQSQEQMASIVSIPLVKFLGITPSGLNASSDGEIRVFYDWIKAFQEHLFAKPLDTIFAMVQLSEFGEVDPDLTYSFEPLWALNEKEQAEVDQIRAGTAQTHIDAGALSPMEERQRIAADPDSPYSALNVEDMPETPMEPESGGLGDDPNEQGDRHQLARVYKPTQAQDAEFSEADHSRDESGKFSGSVHVVSTNNPDNDRTRIHGVYANENDAKKAHKAELHKAYGRFRVANYGGEVSPHTPSWVAKQTLQDHGRPVPTLQSVHVGGESAPTDVSLVHEAAMHEDGHNEARMHDGSADHAEAVSKAERIAEAFWNADHQSYDDDDQPESFPGLRRANARQHDVELMSQGEGRTGVFNVTRHSVIQ